MFFCSEHHRYDFIYFKDDGFELVYILPVVLLIVL